ncbi:YpdA family putative bacillithiol disulfide reductase [Lentibacillus sp. CBA3610]|uniref:YpdA family putative bacillithiol disulfide reductase n=1 Tax=Lentibacillus sp. CBA3610 TaxID=2518176 RepID=UPI00159632D2|nr:YpdA family putative bacillithiol disulfide reductase [Lentibacillus sp. CBA3610]QKY71616.1 YpdA family putative bacillithiol disulfide reductase [Lentibacillus sp. CBA3610]
MQKEDTIIIGGGPCGMACAIDLQEHGINPLIIEKENVVNTIYNFPTHQTFFSSSDKLEIGGIPFITEKQKPVRNQALAYYRDVSIRKNLRVNTFERVIDIVSSDNNNFRIETKNEKGLNLTYIAENVIIATGYYDQPNNMNIPGEELPKVMHYFKEAHPYLNKNIVVIGGKNSAVDTTLELHKAGANIMVLYRGDDYSKSIKPWILPEFDSLVRKEIVQMEFNAQIQKITHEKVIYTAGNKTKEIDNDFVFAMTGYKPDLQFLKQAGIQIDEETGRPYYEPETMETNVPGIYVAGVVASGYNNNEIFIENGRFHGGTIARAITSKG